MTLKDIVASVTEMKATIGKWVADKTAASAEAIAIFQTKLADLESGAAAALSAAQASIADLTGKLSTATKDLGAATGQITDIKSSLTAALAALKIEIKSDATALEMVSALQTGVSATLARLNVDPGKIPAGPARATQTADGKTKSRADFEALNPQAKMDFIRSGGRILAD